MRTNDEVLALVTKLEKHNSIIDRQLRDNTADDGCFAAYNSNSMLLCALRWVLGEDTITVRESP